MKTLIVSAALAASCALAQDAPAPAPAAPAAPAEGLTPAVIEQGTAAQKKLFDAMTSLRDSLAGVTDKATADAAAPKVAESCAAFLSAVEEGEVLCRENPALGTYLEEHLPMDEAALAELAESSLGSLLKIVLSGAFESEDLMQAATPLLQFLLNGAAVEEQDEDVDNDVDEDDGSVFDEDVSDIE